MREIKFRGKRIGNGGWVHGFLYISNISGCYILQCVSFAKKTKEGMNLGDKVVELEVNPSTVGQYTGLKDKNGMEIYEGDIAKIPDDYNTYGLNAGEAYEVYFAHGGFRLKPKYNSLHKGYWLEDDGEFSIIGNIYD